MISCTLTEYFEDNADRLIPKYIEQNTQSHTEFCSNNKLEVDCPMTDLKFIESVWNDKEFKEFLLDDYLDTTEDECACPECDGEAWWKREFDTNYNWLECNSCGWRSD